MIGLKITGLILTICAETEPENARERSENAGRNLNSVYIVVKKERLVISVAKVVVKKSIKKSINREWKE